MPRSVHVRTQLPRRWRGALLWLLCLPPLSAAAQGDESLRLLPASIALRGPVATQRLLVQRVADEHVVGHVSEAVVFESSDPQVASIEQGVVVARGNGTATVRATVGEQTTSAEVTVEGFDQPFVWSFRHHVEPVLSKAGCNSGACHGAQAGKKGFRLSLRGYDPAGDFDSLTRDARGRRIIPSDPGRSLILTKPTGAIPHGGGVRFDVDSLDYRVLSEWIAAGTPPPAADDPALQRLEILPSSVVLRPEDEQPLVVRAHYSDGRVEDVTHWVKYTSTNQTVCEVDEQGRVHVMGYGEGAVTAWYSSQVVAATVTVPFEQEVDPAVFADSPRHNFIDELILAKLASLNLPPSPPCSDAEFIRRATIDTIGVLPTAEETTAFLADENPDKRQQLIDRLLARPELVDYWTYKWSDLLLVNSDKLRPPAMWSYYNWIRNHVAANTPWDRVAAELLTATGSTLQNGATNFFVLHEDPFELAENTSVALLGMSINCARCHNHPLEKWTNDQYYGMANLFSRVRTKNGPGDGMQVVFSATEGELIQPLHGEAQPPQPLDGQALAFDADIDRREHLARWLTSPENPLFKRAIVNRVWANFMGVGLVEMVDDLRQTNPPSNAELLTALSDYLVEQEFDLQALMRLILESAAYQRSSAPLPENAADERFYARYYPRRLMAEVMLDAFSQVTGSPTQFPDYPDTWRALQLPDSNVDSYFLRTFGRPERVITCECERVAEPSMVQVLHISNGDAINAKLAAPGNVLDELLSSGVSNEELIAQLYLSALARHPTAEEQSEILKVFAEVGDGERRTLLEDLYWGVLSSREFLFNH